MHGRERKYLPVYDGKKLRVGRQRNPPGPRRRAKLTKERAAPGGPMARGGAERRRVVVGIAHLPPGGGSARGLPDPGGSIPETPPRGGRRTAPPEKPLPSLFSSSSPPPPARRTGGRRGRSNEALWESQRFPLTGSREGGRDGQRWSLHHAA